MGLSWVWSGRGLNGGVYGGWVLGVGFHVASIVASTVPVAPSPPALENSLLRRPSAALLPSIGDWRSDVLTNAAAAAFPTRQRREVPPPSRAPFPNRPSSYFFLQVAVSSKRKDDYKKN